MTSDKIHLGFAREDPECEGPWVERELDRARAPIESPEEFLSLRSSPYPQVRKAVADNPSAQHWHAIFALAS